MSLQFLWNILLEDVQTSFNLEIFSWLKFVCFDSSVGMASSAAPEENSSQQQITIFFQGLKLVLHLPAKSFNKTDKINFVHHKILINFCEMKNYSEECTVSFLVIKVRNFLLHKSMPNGLTWRYPQEFFLKKIRKKFFVMTKKNFQRSEIFLIVVNFQKDHV